jgi:hypothetical protein
MGARIMAKIKANEKKMNSNSQIWTSGPRLDFGRYIAVSGECARLLVGATRICHNLNSQYDPDSQLRLSTMELITKKSELFANIQTLRRYLRDPGVDRDFALGLVRLGICFAITEEDGNAFFAPSRFVGYRGNTRHHHSNNDEKDGRKTNAALEQFLRAPPTPSETLEREYEQFCAALGIQVRKAPFGIARKFWDLRSAP